MNEPLDALARPPLVKLMRDARRIASPDGIEELMEVAIGDSRQWLSIRGRDRRNPVLLFIHGGPGSPEMPISWLYQTAWEDYFVVVQWDQRGCGKSAGAAWPDSSSCVSPMEVMRADAQAVVTLLRERFACDKIFVLGHSWGTVLGTLLAREHPEWLHAYIGVGQMVEWGENERASYAHVTQQAVTLGLSDAITELSTLSPYPDMRATEAAMHKLLVERKWVVQMGGMLHGRRDLEALDQAKLLCPEYTDADLATGDGVEAAVLQLMPELLWHDARKITRLDCPVVLAAGRFDQATPSGVALAWYERLEATEKSWIWFERSSHMPHIEEPGRFLTLLVNVVLPLAFNR